MNKKQLQNWQRAQRQARAIVQAYRDEAPVGADPVNIEGWAAAAVAVAAVGASAYSAYSSSSAAQSQAEAMSHQPGVIPYQAPDPVTSFDNYELYRDKVLPKATADANAQNDVNNAAFQGRLTKTSPNLLSGISAEGTLANKWLNGELGDEITGNVERSSAFKALSGGYAGSGASHALTARDLGVATLDLQTRGANLLSQNLASTAAVNPYNTTADSSILTANQFLGRDDQNAAIANATANKNQQVQFQNSLYANAASNINPTAGAITSGIGTLSSLYFGGAGRGMMSGGGGSSYGGGGNSDPTGAAGTMLASGNGYNPYLDSNNYDAAGNFIGNANSFYTGG